MSGQREFAFTDQLSTGKRRAADGNAAAGIDRTPPTWLGLVTSHRRLFDASQDGWLRPPAGTCFLLGRESFVSEQLSAGRNAIPVRLAFDVDKLPFPDARKEFECAEVRREKGDEPGVVHWHAPVPLYATTTVEVPSDEQKMHLLAMVGQFSNLSLPDAPVVVADFAPEPPPTGDRGTPETRPLELPEALNAIQGAMAMAVWAVPHVEPWIEVLRRTLGRNAAGVAQETARLDAQWLQIPWLDGDRTEADGDDSDGQGRLWRAALSCMEWPNAGEESPAAVADRIARAARLDDTNPWLERTRRIVAGNETISRDDWRGNGAGLAIWLALLRPDPMRFRSWNKDLPGLPPGIWWAAAILCGWRHGYRALDKEFRGDSGLQEYLATRALAVSWPDGEATALPASQRSPLERMREDGYFTLAWRGEPVLRKEWKARAKWYAADLTGIAAGNAARHLAGRLDWPCIERRLALPAGRLRAEGSGRWFVDGDDLVVEGEKSLRLPRAADVNERVDPDEFRRLLATEAGVVPDPPEPYPLPLKAVAGAVMDPTEAYRHPPVAEVSVAPEPSEDSRDQPESAPPGLIYRPDFVTEEEETRLLECIDCAEWITELQRRVQHYGWRYDYKKRGIDGSAQAPELPEWARELGRRLVDKRLMPDPPDQLIVNEYCGEQGITPHIDHPDDFAEHVATVSLLETWDMRFTLGRKEKPYYQTLERRSVAILTGDARYKWKHEIPKRKNEPRRNRPGKGRWIKRSRRVSLTFRRTHLNR